MNIQNFGTDGPLMEEFSLDDIKNRISTRTAVTAPPETVNSMNLLPPIDMSPIAFGQEGKVGQVEYNVPFEAIYDRNRDGSYTAKYDNYKGAFGNEERLANQQGTFEKLGKGAVRFAEKTTLNALDATVGTVAGIFNGIQKGELSAVWDNDVSNWLDDMNKQVNYQLPIYYTDEYKSQNILEKMFFNPATFISTDFADAMAFVTGALLPEVAIAYATGGTSLAVTGSKLAARGALGVGKAVAKGEFKQAVKSVSKYAAESVAKKAARKEAVDLARVQMRSNLGKYAGEVVKTGAFVARTSNFEAGMEARHNFHDAVEGFHLTFEEQNGRPPTLEETTSFYEDAKEAGNLVYGANMAILSVSNIAMFGAKFGIANNTRKAINDFGNKFIGLSPTKGVGGKLVLGEATKGQKILGKTYKKLSGPLTEGLYEEGLQGVVGKTMQDYMAAKYNPELDETYGFMNSLEKGFKDTYGTVEGWNEIGMGMLIGFAAPLIQGGKPAGFGSDSYTSVRSGIQQQVDAVNAGMESAESRLTTNMNNANTAKVFRDRMLTEQQDASDNGTIPPRMDMNNTIIAKGFIESQSHLKPMKDIVADYEAIIESTELSEEIQDQVGDVAEYKRGMVEEFRNNVKNYKAAKSIVNNLGLNRKIKTGLTKGNELEIGDYLVTTMMLGQAAQQSADGIGNDIERMVGKDGIKDAMKFYSDLKENQQAIVEELDTKRIELEEKRKLFVESSREIASFAGTSKELTEGSAAQKRQNQIAEQHEMLRDEVTKLDAEVTQMQETLESDIMAADFKLPSELGDFGGASLIEKLSSLEQLDKYTESLRKNGREADANSLDYMIGQYKNFNDAQREVNNLFSMMGDTKFFSTEGGVSLVNSIVGPNYEMSEETMAKVRENNEIIDSQLNRFGVRDYLAVEEKLKAMLEENENLSDREKFKLEGLIRLQLNAQSRVDEAYADMAQKEEAIAEKDLPNDPLAGDSIALRVRKIVEDSREDTSKRLGKLIDEMLSAVDQKRATSKAMQPEVVEEETEIETEVEKSNPTTAEQVLELKIRDLAEERSSEFGNPDMIAQLEEEIAQLQNTEEVVVQETPEETVEKEPKIIDSEEYARIEELNKKSLTEPLTQDEIEELEQLEDDLDRWIAITGMEVDGFRLSDLIKLKNQLDNTEILDVEKADNLTPQQKLDGLFKDKGYGPKYDFGQSYGAVTSTGVTKGGLKYVSIQGISLEDLNDELPEGFGLVDSTEEFPEEVQKGNIVISQEEADRVNLGRNGIMINPPSENLTSNYGVVVKEDDKGNLTPLKSSHATDFAKPMKVNTIYDQEVGSEVILEVDPKDPMNVELLNALRVANETQDPERIVEAKQALRKSLVIRTRVGGSFNSVLKAKNNSGEKNLGDDMRFEAMRDELIDNEKFLTEILENDKTISQADPKSKFPVKGQVTLKNILPGQPNFNMARLEDGTTVINSLPFKESDTEKIVDIGYLEKGKVRTRTGKQDDGSVDTTFIKTFEKNKNKVPFIVIKKGTKKYAYPITLKSTAGFDNSELETVFNSEMSDISKVLRLNEMLAKRGIDIKGNGDNFNPQNIMSTEFFKEKLAQVESIEYLYDLDAWVTGNEKMETILQEQALIDINLSDPFHSPKMSFDYKGLKVDITSYVKSQPAKNDAVKKNGSLVSSAELDAIKNDKSDCKK